MDNPQLPQPSNRGLTAKVVRGGAWVYGRMLVTNVVNLGVMAILARELSPAEFGLVALAQALIRFLVFLGSESISQYVIYDNRTGREERVQAAFWMDLSFSTAAVLLGLLFVPLITRFYSEPGLGAILFVLLLRYPVDSLSRVPDALLKKSLDFQKLETRDTVLEILIAFTSVVMALTGWGAWSLVIPGVVASPLRALILLRLTGWRPRLILYLEQWPRIFSYSVNITGGALLYYIISEADTLLIGKLMGSHVLGIYNLAWQSANLVNRVIVSLSNKLTFPALSTISANIQHLRDALGKIFRVLAVTTFPALIGLLVVADDFILTVYGPQWKEAVLPLRILIIYALRYAIGSPTGAVYRVIGRPDIVFKLPLLIAPFYLVAIWVGSIYGIVGVATGVTIVRTVFGFVDFGIVARCLKVSFREVIKPVIPSFFASCWMGSIVLLAKLLLDLFLAPGNLIKLIVLVSLGCLAYSVLIRTHYRSLAQDLARVYTPLLGPLRVSFNKVSNWTLAKK